MTRPPREDWSTGAGVLAVVLVGLALGALGGLMI